MSIEEVQGRCNITLHIIHIEIYYTAYQSFTHIQRYQTADLSDRALQYTFICLVKIYSKILVISSILTLMYCTLLYVKEFSFYYQSSYALYLKYLSHKVLLSCLIGRPSTFTLQFIHIKHFYTTGQPYEVSEHYIFVICCILVISHSILFRYTEHDSISSIEICQFCKIKDDSSL